MLLCLLLLAGAYTFVVSGQTAPLPIPPVVLPGQPLYGAAGGDKPVIALALSVEYSTVGAQYLANPGDTTDATYSSTQEYLGYYDAESCYTYNKTPSEQPAPGMSSSDYQRFDRTAAADKRTCTNAFSGNFLNWTSSSALDMLRLALSGGDRYIDTPKLTVLQRAVIPDGDPVCMFNTASFPAKQLQKDGGGKGRYWGAVPAVMMQASAGNDIWVANTLNRIYFGTKRTGDCGDTASYTLGAPDRMSKADTALNTEGFFFARVQVCNTESGTLQDVRDYGLCTAYAAGNYKPTGSIQKYSNQLRLAAFGYLMDQTDSNAGGRYGGVLRSPMKFVGTKTFSINGAENTAPGGNPNAEWDPLTGVIYSNPDADAMNISGVINYVNKFGRTGKIAGRYKNYDPLGELYYETLRYLQGFQPTSAAISAITPDMKDGFPVSTVWTDPYGNGRTPTADYSCLKSNIVVIGGTKTRDGNRWPAASASGNVPDINSWTSTVQKFEMNSMGSYLDGQGIVRAVSNPNVPLQSNPPGNAYIGTAYWAHTHDIRGSAWTTGTGLANQRPGLRVKSWFFDVNEAGNSRNVNYQHQENPFFIAAKYGGFESNPDNAGARPYNMFGNPFQKQDGTYDNNVWQNASNPQMPGTYYLHSSPREVFAAFDSIFNNTSSSARSVAGAATASQNLTSVASAIFQGSFDASDWSGDVLSVPVGSAGENHAISVGKVPNWTAATRLNSLFAPAASRNIVIGNVGATSPTTARAFKWSDIGPSFQAMLDKSTPTANADGLGEARLNYLRGEKALEGKPFRLRRSLLGDIVNSGIAYSGPPSSSLGAQDQYNDFYTSNSARAPAVFVGANDGMLHAFHAETGDELFAYIPSWMGRKLAALTTPAYNANHQSYVDATPVVAEGRTGYDGAATDWKTVLVSGTGGGGSGVFALDVTNPAAFSPAKVLWEFTRADDPDLGYVVGRPQIVKARTSAPGATPVYRWFALVASGINNYLPDPAFGSVFSATGKPALFMLALDKPAGAPWTTSGLSPNYYKISVPVDGIQSTTMATGLLNFRATFGQAAELAQVYMGDLHGKLWKLDFSLRGSSEWTMEKLSPYKKGTSAPFTPYPLYIAKDATGMTQPISVAPTLVSGPASGNVPGIYVFFSTGKFLETSDKASTAKHSIYAVYDNGSTSADSSPVGSSVISGRGRLQAGVANASNGQVTVPAFKWGRATSNSDTSQRSGWYVDFPSAGERGISNASVVGDHVVLGSLIPAALRTASSCAANSGGNQYVLNVDTGSGTVTESSVGIAGEPMLAEVMSATTYGPASTTGRMTKTSRTQVFEQGANGVKAGAIVTHASVVGRLSWRQVNNYHDLKNSP